MEKKPVKFDVGLKENVNANSVKKGLEKLASDLNIIVERLGKSDTYLVSGTTSKETYERLFNAKLKYSKETLFPWGFQYYEAWNETKSASVPESLKNKIEYIRPAIKVGD